MSVEQAAREIAAIVTESPADVERVRSVMDKLRLRWLAGEDE